MKIVPLAETQMDLETIQSEVSEKEKNKYILIHICGIQRNCADGLICKAKIEIPIQRTNIWIPRGERRMRDELGDWN